MSKSIKLQHNISKPETDNKKSRLEIVAIITNIASCLATIGLVVFAAYNYRELVKNVELIADQVTLQKEYISNIKKDMFLTHKPVVYIKDVLPPAIESEAGDAKTHRFIVTNSGKNQATDLKITVDIDHIFTDKFIHFTNFQAKNSVIFNNATIYPGQELTFTLSKYIIKAPIKEEGRWETSLITFLIDYRGEGLDGSCSEKQRYFFSKETGFKWVLVGPNFDINIKKDTK